MNQFENDRILDDEPENPTDFEHNEQELAAQKASQQQVDFPDNRNCTSETVANTIRTLEDIGTTQYQDFVTTILVDRFRSIHNPMSKNSLPLFSTKVAILNFSHDFEF